jgi:hypothetical protein
MMQRSWFVAHCVAFTLLAAIDCSSSAADDRRVWEYTGGFGPTWFVHVEGKKWVLYRGDGRTFLYVEDRRTDELIELRGPYTNLLIRLTADQFQSRRSPDDSWRQSARGRWVSEMNVPERIRLEPKAYAIRLVYFVPSDREPVPSYAPKIRQIMSLVAQLIHEDLRAKGHRPKRLEFESRKGEPVVHIVRGTKRAADYNANWDTDPQSWVNPSASVATTTTLLFRGSDPRRRWNYGGDDGAMQTRDEHELQGRMGLRLLCNTA